MVALRIVEIGVPVEEFTKAAVMRAHRAGLIAQGRYWHKEILPRHFRKGADTKYHYKARKPKYQRRKDKMRVGPLIGVAYKMKSEGGKVTLKVGGTLKAASTKASISSTAKGVKVKMENLPDYIKVQRVDDVAKMYTRLIKAISEGRSVKKNQERLAALRRSSTAKGGYPDITKEMVITLPEEVKEMFADYDWNAVHTLARDPLAYRKVKKVLTK